jgi:hypothetical protein
MSNDPIAKRYRRAMNSIATAIDETFNGTKLPKKVVFVMLIAEFGNITDGRVNYISNGDRRDIVVMLKEILARFEGQPEQQGTA